MSFDIENSSFETELSAPPQRDPLEEVVAELAKTGTYTYVARRTAEIHPDDTRYTCIRNVELWS